MDIPKHLKHRPILVVENYNKYDGIYDEEHTDAMGLSVGIAQWNDIGETDLSAKVWRYTGEKWSRQSEELPLHRILDLATLICEALNYAKNDDPSSLKEFPVSFKEPNNTALQKILKKELLKKENALDEQLQRLKKSLEKLV